MVIKTCFLFRILPRRWHLTPDFSLTLRSVAIVFLVIFGAKVVWIQFFHVMIGFGCFDPVKQFHVPMCHTHELFRLIKFKGFNAKYLNLLPISFWSISDIERVLYILKHNN